MKLYSSAQAAKALGLTQAAITKYIKSGKIPVPKMMEGVNRYIWTAADIEHVRQLLPKIANGRKTRYKKQSAVGNQQSAKTKAQPRAAVPHKQRKPKKK